MSALRPAAESAPPSARTMRRIRACARLRFWAIFLVRVVVGGASAGVYRFRQAQAAAILPSAPARQGEFLVIIRCRGELKAEPLRADLRSHGPQPPHRLDGPSRGHRQAGRPIVTLRFLQRPAGTPCRRRPPSARPRPPSIRPSPKPESPPSRTKRSRRRQVHRRARPPGSLQAGNRQPIQGEESQIDFGVAQQKLKVQEATVALHASLRQGPRSPPSPASATRPSRKWTSPKSRIAQMETQVRPSPACSSLSLNYSQGWVNAKPFKVGDNVFSGMDLAEMPDLNTLRSGRQGRRDRSRPHRRRTATSWSASIPSPNSPSPPKSARSRSSPRPATSSRPPAASAPMPPSPIPIPASAPA